MRPHVLHLLACALLGALLATRPAQAFDPSPLLDKASEALEEGRLMDALAMYRAVHDGSPDALVRCESLVRSAGVLALFADQPGPALEAYGQAVSLSSSVAGSACLDRALVQSGMLLYERGRVSDARSRFAQSLELFPSGPQAETSRSMLELLEGEADRDPVPVIEPWRNGEPFIRVDLTAHAALSLELPAGGQLLLPDGAWEPLSPGGHTATVLAGGLVLDGRSHGRELRLVPTGAVRLDGVDHTGELALIAEGGGVRAVLHVAMERYVEGVVVKEMGADFPLEALKAQAVAARSYAANMLMARSGRVADVSADTWSQVYGGVVQGLENVVRAVEETRGVMLMHEGGPALAYYHSHSGGMLEDDAAVWNADFPFLQVGPDPQSLAGRDMSWELSMTLDEVGALLAANGYGTAAVRSVRWEGRTASGRVRDVVVDTADGPVAIPAATFRLLAGPARMKSTLCQIVTENEVVVMTGQGFGHGVGMSQWGAWSMGVDGEPYTAILAHYYPGAELGRMW